MVREFSERLLELRPESIVALEGLAAWACAAGDHALTAKFCTLLVSAVPGHFEGWFNLGLAHQKSGRWEQAAEAYEEALKLRPQSAESPYQPGHRARTTGRSGWRPRRLRPRGGIQSRGARAHMEPGAPAGTHRPSWKKPSATTARFWKKPRAKRKRASAWASCACSARTTAAPPKLSKAASNIVPVWPEAHANLALAYSGMGEREHAERLYEKMLESDPKSVEALRGLAAMAIQASDFDTALEFHVRLIDLGERSPEILYNTGLMYEKAGKLDNAVRLYRDALALEPHMPEALLNMGRILETTGKSEEARACWAKALEAEPALAQGYFGPAID